MQAPALQVLPPVQALPQAPQWVLLVCVLTQVPLHNVPPLGQVQLPVVQVWPAAQAVPQVPQLAVSVWRFTQELPHFVVPPVQLAVH